MYTKMYTFWKIYTKMYTKIYTKCIHFCIDFQKVVLFPKVGASCTVDCQKTLLFKKFVNFNLNAKFLIAFEMLGSVDKVENVTEF